MPHLAGGGDRCLGRLGNTIRSNLRVDYKLHVAENKFVTHHVQRREGDRARWMSAEMSEDIGLPS